ncbi:MAG: hypothetical protein ACOYNY_24910 [Caldilineaceae bacterium]|jgi:hypothetical protein
MAKRVVYDRWHHEIYITSERWQHILERHEELIELFEEVLKTIQYGRRRQEELDPNRYRYYYPCALLPPEFNYIVVAVVFRYQESPNGHLQPNNFVTSAWGVDIYRDL